MKLIISFLFLGFLSIYIFQQPNTAPKEFRRIVALSPAHSQLLKYLDLTDKIIATSIYDRDPLVQHTHKISGGIVVSEEDLLRLKPDLVFIGDIQGTQDLKNFLDSKNIAHATLPTRSLKDIGKSLDIIRKFFPQQTSESISSNFQQQLNSIKQSSPKNRRKALMILDIDPVYTLSTNDFLSEVYQYSGWDSVIQSDIPYPVLTEEQLFSLGNVQDILIQPFLTNEMDYIKKIQRKLNAENIIIITNQLIELPSPYLLDIIKELRIQQSSL